MPAAEFKKRGLYFIVFSGVIISILVILPFFETFARGYLYSQFGMTVTPDGNVSSASGGSEPGMMVATTFSLAVNIFALIRIFLWMALVISIVRFLTYLIFSTAFRSAAQSEIASLIKTVLSIVIYIVSFFIIFQSQYPGVQLAPLFTGSTIIGIVVGLAMQDTLGNLFSGIAMQADQSFQVGDVVMISNRGSGVVEGVSWRGVRIRTFQNKLLVLSNAVMGQETIEVAPRDNLNARLVNFSTRFEHSPARTIQLVRDAVRQVENVSQKIRPVVRIRNLGENGIDWEIKYWAEDYSKHNDTDSQIRQRIWYVFNREGIRFPHPLRIVYSESAVAEPEAVEFINTASAHLHHVPIFSPLSDAELEKLATASTSEIFAPGEEIVRVGSEGSSMFVIIYGAVTVQVPDDGGTRTIGALRANDFFGEMSLLTGEPRSATVIADEETEVLRIEKSALKPLFEDNPALVQAICDAVDERKIAHGTQSKDENVQNVKNERGVIVSIKKFFGLE